MKQTAVEWLVEQYANENYGIEVYKQAKEMEKEQIIDAYNKGYKQGKYDPYFDNEDDDNI
jgi:N-acetyl-anhydromuramyl-L-alanine amidase AmpD